MQSVLAVLQLLRGDRTAVFGTVANAGLLQVITELGPEMTDDTEARLCPRCAGPAILHEGIRLAQTRRSAGR